MYFVSINAGAQVAIILLACGPCVVIVNCLGQVLYLGRAPRTKETLLDFRKWCRVTQHPRLFRRLTGCQRTPRFSGVTAIDTVRRHGAEEFYWSSMKESAKAEF